SLRLGLMYSPEDEQSRSQLSSARLGISPVFGPDKAYWPALWVTDAVRAFENALETPAGTYDVVADRPLTRAEVRIAVARAAGRSKLLNPPGFAQRMMLGDLLEPLSRSLRVSNKRFAAAANWRPNVSNAAAGWMALAGK